MTIRRHWTKAGVTLVGCVLLASASGAAAQTCRTSLSTGLILCDTGATARTSPVNGTTRFSDGTSFRTVPVETVSTPLKLVNSLANQGIVTQDAALDSALTVPPGKRPVPIEVEPNSAGARKPR